MNEIGRSGGTIRRNSAIERMLRPRSIAIVGASPSPGSLGAGLLANLERFAFAGEIHLVNASRTEINGRPCVNNGFRAAHRR